MKKLLLIALLSGCAAEPSKVEDHQMVITAVSGGKFVAIDAKDPLTGETAHISVGMWNSSDFPVGKTVNVRVRTYVTKSYEVIR